MEMYPNMIKNKFSDKSGDRSQLNSQWKELADTLNSLGYGQKSVEKWQLVIQSILILENSTLLAQFFRPLADINRRSKLKRAICGRNYKKQVVELLNHIC